MQQTNHYILLTNVSTKRCIRPGSEMGSSGGEESYSHLININVELNIFSRLKLIGTYIEYPY